MQHFKLLENGKLVDGDGVEPPQPEAPDLQSGGLANAQPIQ